MNHRENIQPLLDLLDKGRSAEGAHFNAKGADALYSLYRMQANNIDSADRLIETSERSIEAHKGLIEIQNRMISNLHEIMWLWFLLGLLLGWAVS
jgi:hypothetical protein